MSTTEVIETVAQEDSSRLEEAQQSEVVGESPSDVSWINRPTSPHLQPYHFQPGESGNPGGVRKRPASFQELTSGINEEAKRRMVLALVRKAEKGDVRAFEELANRAEGKPATRIIVTQTDAESPLVSALQRIAQRIAQAEGVTVEGEARVLQPGADSLGVSEDR